MADPFYPGKTQPTPPPINFNNQSQNPAQYSGSLVSSAATAPGYVPPTSGSTPWVPSMGAGDTSGNQPTATNYYSRTGATPAQTAAGSAAAQALATPYTASQQNTDEQSLIAQRRAESQAQIDAINQGFGAQFGMEHAAGDVRMQQTNAQNVAMGLVGSPDAAAASAGTSTKNQQNLSNIAAQQASTVAGM